MVSPVARHRGKIEQVVLNFGEEIFAFYPFRDSGKWTTFLDDGNEVAFQKTELPFLFDGEKYFLDLTQAVWYSQDNQRLPSSMQQRLYEKLREVLISSNRELIKHTYSPKLVSFVMKQIIPRIKI